MKQKVLLYNLTPRWGMLHYSSQFSNELVNKKGIELKVAIASYHSSSLYSEHNSFIRIRSNPDMLSFILDSVNVFYHIYFWYKVLLYKPDIIHFIDNHPWYSIHVKIWKFLWKKIYVTQHDPTLHSGEAKSLVWKIAAFTNKVLRNNADKLIVHGDVLRDEVVHKYSINANKVVSIPHGAYTFFNEYAKGLATEKNTFLFFWRILDYKWLDVLLESLEYIKKEISNFKLIIAGPGDISEYKELLEKNKNYIEIYNYHIEAEDAYQFFEVSEFVVLPYHDASWSGVIPVAYCFSKAVLVTGVWELPSVVEDTVTGYIIKPGNAQILWEKIVEMLGDKNKLKQMWKSWYEYSLKELSWEPIINKIY